MFRHLGNLVVRGWPLLLAGWVAALFVATWAAPEWDSVIQDGESAYFPEDAPSRQAEDLYLEAFSRDMLGSSVVIVARRPNRPEGLITREDIAALQTRRQREGASPADVPRSDFDFIDDGREGGEAPDDLKEWIERIAREEGGLAFEDDDSPGLNGQSTPGRNGKSIIGRVLTYRDRPIGELFLVSKDRKATLVIVELATGFLDKGNRATIDKIEALISEDGELHRRGLVPPGLELAMSGGATVGRDMRAAAEQSAKKIDGVTLLLVMVILVLIYRSPLLAAIPLVTVGIAVHIARKVLAIVAPWGVIHPFAGIEIYVTVVLFGAGVDYCMFLMARYKEELDAGRPLKEAMARSIEKVGTALAASAGTTICGIGMMYFATFGKFQEAGKAMSLSLVFVLLAALTFTPPLLLLFGRWAFWPNVRSERIRATEGWITPTSLMARLMERNWLRGLWDRVGSAVVARPATIWLATIGAMLPFAVVAGFCYDLMTYGLLNELPQDEPSVVGAKAVEEHFPAGIGSPVRLLVENHTVDFSRPEGRQLIEQLTQALYARRDDLGIDNILSVSSPLGIAAPATDEEQGLFRGRIQRERANRHYVSDQGEFKNRVTRIDVMFRDDPFSRDSIDQFERLRETVREILPASLGRPADSAGTGGTRLLYLGQMPSIRDLKTVTGSDRVRINWLVLGSVYLVLVLLLRRAAISAYLIVSVFFSYLATLGVTYAVFWALDPAGFAGLDWKVPIFLFTILVAVGQDYNIYLITRIEEETLRHGPIRGITVALSRTGKIISGCGLIMAGTFSSLMAGSLTGMVQLGFALAFGVLLDTFVVRPVLVPAWLVLLNSGRLGTMGRYLGAAAEPETMPIVEEIPVRVGTGSGLNGRRDNRIEVPPGAPVGGIGGSPSARDERQA